MLVTTEYSEDTDKNRRQYQLYSVCLIDKEDFI